ncbi:MAG: GNAT family N-acetyltransferase [Candidatus Heimdallarchaeota archaeon]|nr:MAG: GNAT family N-acetyltransferase [Candidatus Heimdallarchaeota archaeon]
MLSVEGINQKLPSFESFDLHVEFRINGRLYSFDNDSMDQVFMGENISLKRAIEQKMELQCFIDVGEEIEDIFFVVGSISLTWKPKESECYIGLLWINPSLRGNGLATFFLNEISTFADELGIVLALHALPFINPQTKPTIEDISKFKEFFRQFGFRDNLQTNGIGYDNLMERLPRP